MKFSRDEKIEWILEYMEEHKYVSSVDTDFVNSFVDKFNPKIRIMNWGANKCRELNRLLAFGYKQGKFSRRATGLGINWMYGFPKWVYVYSKGY